MGIGMWKVTVWLVKGEEWDRMNIRNKKERVEEEKDDKRRGER